MKKVVGLRKGEKLKVACIGAGSSGAGHLVMLEQYEPGCCVAFCDRSRELFDAIVDGYLGKGDLNAAGDFKNETFSLRPSFRDLPFYTDPDEMFEKEDINTVVISTWCSAHAEMVEKCAKHGMNILVEKPIAINEADVEKVWRLLKNYPKVATVNFTMRPAPVSLAAKRHVENGDIGKIISVQYVNNVHYGDIYFRTWMRTQKSIGNLFLQKAVHDLDIINNIIGLKPVSIAAFGSRLVYGGNKPNDLTCDTCNEKMTCPMSVHKLFMEAAKPLPPKHCRKCVYSKEIDIDDNQVMIIKYEGGVTASYCQTFNAPMRGFMRGGQFIGTGGTMSLQYYGEFLENCKGEELVGNSRIDIMKYCATPGTKISEVYDWAGHGHFDGTEYGLRAKIDLIYDRPTEVKTTIEEGYISAKMCLAAQKSIETGKVIKLDLTR